MQASEVKQKVVNTMLARYGAEYYTQVKEIAEKIKNTNIERYGSEYTFTSDIIKERIRKVHRTKKYHRNISLLNDYETYLIKPLLNFKCNLCGEEFEAPWGGQAHNHIWCPKCHKSHSNGEDQIYTFLAHIVGKDKILRNKRTVLSNNKELDLYIPDFGLATEFDRLYWHREEAKGANYHLDKTLECQKIRYSINSYF